MNGESFSINFVRREVIPLRLRRAGAAAAMVYWAANGALAAWFLSNAFILFGQSRQIQAGFREKPTAALSGDLIREMETLRGEALKDLAQLNADSALQRKKFFVGGKLAALTTTLPDRVWITGLSGSRDQRTVKIQAAYLVDPEAPHRLPAKGWVDALRADPRFSQGLRRLDPGPSSRKKQGEAELFDFELGDEWESGPAS